MPDWLATDDLTIVLGLVFAGILVTGTFLKPQSLVHPILLGRQSDVDRVRNKGESAVYRNYGTGLMGRLPARPAREIQVAADLLKPDFHGSRTLWSTKITNSELKARASSLGAGLVKLAGLIPNESNVLLLLNDSLEFLITDLALSSHGIPSFTLASLTVLSSVLDTHPPGAIILHAHFLNQVLELILENHDFLHHTLIVVGDDVPKSVEKLKGQVRILMWQDLEGEGAKLGSIETARPKPEDVFSVSFYSGTNNELKAAKLTHENLTAGVTSTRLLLPLNAAITPADSILSAHSLSTPYGRAIAYTALYDGTSFATVPTTALYGGFFESTKSFSTLLEGIPRALPQPTILFITPQYLNSLTSSILAHANRSNPLFFLAWRHKLAALQEGFISNNSVWDKWAFASARQTALNGMSDSLRAVIIGDGQLMATALTPTRIALSVPVVNVHTHPLVAGPVFASHPQDLQSFSTATHEEKGDLVPFAAIAHVGPPALNLEAKLLGLDDAAVEAGASPKGEIIFRGPPVCRSLDEDDELPDLWVRAQEHGLVQNNGTFKVLAKASSFA